MGDRGFVGGDQVRCERRIEVFCENAKKSRGREGGPVGGVRVDVNEELNLL